MTDVRHLRNVDKSLQSGTDGKIDGRLLDNYACLE